MIPPTQRLKGLFDRPISSPIDTDHPLVKQALQSLSSGYQIFSGEPPPCPAGYLPNAFGGCDEDPYQAQNPSPPQLGFQGGSGGDGGGNNTVITVEQTPASVTVNNTVNITDQQLSLIADAVNKAIQQNQQMTDQAVDSLNKAIVGNIQEESDGIKSSIESASTNLGDEVKITSTAIAASTAATQVTVAKGITDELDSVKNAVTPILTSITGFIDKINAEVQEINDTFIQPIVNLYNTTIGTIATLTTAIEADLKDGISGLLKIPGQLADQLGSFDATLDRTVQQLGTLNKETVTSGVDYLGTTFPAPFSAALSQSLTGKSLANSLTTTFADKVTLSSESLAQISAQAITGLGTLLKELLSITASTFTGSLTDLHANWASVESMFTGLLDGALSLLTTLTSIGVLASPLIAAAEQEANALVPVTKLDPATVIAALRRGFIDTGVAMTELKTKGLDTTRSQVLIDLSKFLADANTALDWWYRGIIADEDLIANLLAHGFETEDITAYKQGSINLPALTDLVRWMNFGIITQDQFVANARAIRYDDAQIQAILATYLDRETPQTLSQLNGLLENSSAGFIQSTLSLPVPDTIQVAGQRAGYHPDLVRYIWLNHWALPSVEQFIQSYFRGVRTKTELEQRMAIANIPREMWDDLIRVNQALIPFRSIPSFVKVGYMTLDQGRAELAAHGFDLEHQNIIMKSIQPPADTTNTAATTAIHTLSQSNARVLWGEGAITDAQYIQVLLAHGYTDSTAALQLKADTVSLHIKAQKQELTDLAAEVLAGVTTIGDAITKLNTDGFTNAQISKFQSTILKQLKINAKIPGIADLNKFLKAELITLDQYSDALQQSGWQEPWLSAYIGLVSAKGVPAGQDSGATA